MKKRHSAEQIVAKLPQDDRGLGKGLKMPEHIATTAVERSYCRSCGLTSAGRLRVIDHA